MCVFENWKGRDITFVEFRIKYSNLHTLGNPSTTKLHCQFLMKTVSHHGSQAGFPPTFSPPASAFECQSYRHVRHVPPCLTEMQEDSKGLVKDRSICSSWSQILTSHLWLPLPLCNSYNML